ncbi:MAG: sulfotransferase domain-containing protein [Planctomycetota bacterium]
MSNRLPDFLIVGAMKSGTTTLYEHLDSNPNVFMSTPKEPNYFSIDDIYEKGIHWYASLFASAKPDQVCGEASPSYSRFPRFADTTTRIAQTLPEVKIIYIMRHPVERFYSNYVFDRAYGHSDSIRETLRDRNYVLATSNYMLQIEKYLEHFSREQMLFLLLDDMHNSSRQVMSQVCDFLGVPNAADARENSIQANPRGQNYITRQCNTSLQRFRQLPGMQLVKRLIPGDLRGRIRDRMLNQLPNSRLGKWMSRRHVAQTEPLTADLRTELLDRLAEPTARLEQFLDRDLSAWRV